MTFRAFAGAIALTAVASVASASTLAFNFTNDGTSYWDESQTFYDEGGNGYEMTVTAHTFDNGYNITDDKAWVGRWHNYGLGVCGRVDDGWYWDHGWQDGEHCEDSNHRVDGSHGNDLLKFTLEEALQIKSIHFGSYRPHHVYEQTIEWHCEPSGYGFDWCWPVFDWEYVESIYDDFEFFADLGDGLEHISSDDVAGSVELDGTYVSTMFGIGAMGNYDAFKVRSIELHVAPIPLPAAGWLMLAGIGGLAAVRRKRML